MAVPDFPGRIEIGYPTHCVFGHVLDGSNPQEKKAVFLRFFKVPGTIFITTVSKKNVKKKVTTTMANFKRKVLND